MCAPDKYKVARPEYENASPLNLVRSLGTI